jgi:hypothetical protein
LTTSFEDIILIPLACWVFLLAIPVFFGWKHYKARRADLLATATPKQAEAGEPVMIKSSTLRVPENRSHLKLRWTTYLLFLFTFGILVLTIDEMARLSNLGWGIGLLPFVPITTIIATILYLMRYRLGAIYPKGRVEKGITTMILSFWFFIIIFEIVKVHTLSKLQPHFPREGTSYRTAMQVLDVGIIITCMGLVFILTVVEMMRPWWTVQ